MDDFTTHQVVLHKGFCVCTNFDGSQFRQLILPQAQDLLTHRLFSLISGAIHLTVTVYPLKEK